MKQAVLWLIAIYQRTISPDHSAFGRARYPDGYCRFYPSCSEYGRMAIEKYGVVFGSGKALWRIVRCNPWNSGGTDVP